MDITSISTQSASASAQAGTQLNANFDTFLTLLTTQLQNQDPLEPLDTETFTEQLVQFSNVEQSIQTNQNLEALIALQANSQTQSALSMVGHVTTINTDIAGFDGAQIEWQATLPQDVTNAAARVVDATGATIATLPLAAAAGEQTVIWNGQNAAGEWAEPGLYQLQIDASAADGSDLPSTVSLRTVAEAVSFVNGTPTLEINGAQYALNQVTRIDVAATRD